MMEHVKVILEKRPKCPDCGSVDVEVCSKADWTKFASPDEAKENAKDALIASLKVPEWISFKRRLLFAGVGLIVLLLVRIFLYSGVLKTSDGFFTGLALFSGVVCLMPPKWIVLSPLTWAPIWLVVVGSCYLVDRANIFAYRAEIFKVGEGGFLFLFSVGLYCVRELSLREKWKTSYVCYKCGQGFRDNPPSKTLNG